jgi:hypothetical protein
VHLGASNLIEKLKQISVEKESQMNYNRIRKRIELGGIKMMRLDLTHYESGLGINYEVTNFKTVIVIKSKIYEILNPIVQDEVIEEIAKKYEMNEFNVTMEWDPSWPIPKGWDKIEA